MVHDFILKPGVWIGEGKIELSVSPEFIKFYTKWIITEETSGVLSAIQTVEMNNVEEHVINYFTISEITPATFTIVLVNEMIGTVSGKGLIGEKTIAWEFREEGSFDGFEVYERKESGDYSLHAEYASPDDYRTTVNGLIWQKTS